MRKGSIGLVIGLALLLSGCGETEPVQQEVVDQPPLHTQASQFDNGTISMNSITPVTAFEDLGDEVQLFPFYDCDKHISMKIILTSNNDFWSTLLDSYTDTGNRQDFEKFSLITTSSGNTMTLLPIDDEHAILVESSTLPSGYVKAAADELCK